MKENSQTKDINYFLSALVNYGIKERLITKDLSFYYFNRMVYFTSLFLPSKIFNINYYYKDTDNNDLNLQSIIDGLNSSITLINKEEELIDFDLFFTELINILVPDPDTVKNNFFELYKQSPKDATDYFYHLAKVSNYVRVLDILKNIKYKYLSINGLLDITINLSKPEKDPRLIAKMLDEEKNDNYPLCNLCKENCGFSYNTKTAPRANLRVIPLTLNNEKWYFQYSPYAYFNEHSIVLSSTHRPMKIDRNTFNALFDFVDLFPHYFIGSNADLPIVGGSILTHDHFQAGNYQMPFMMVDALEVEQNKYLDTRIEILNWFSDTISIRGKNRQAIIDIACQILAFFRTYENEEALITPFEHQFEYQNEHKVYHNTITPILYQKDNEYHFNLVLRNNKTTSSYPDGLFHPTKDLHHIKKENIGLIEIMGLAVLPKRLKEEMHLLKQVLQGIIPLTELQKEPLIKHQQWYNEIKPRYDNLKNDSHFDIDDFIEKEIGKVFVKVLECTSIFHFLSPQKKINAMTKLINDAIK